MKGREEKKKENKSIRERLKQKIIRSNVWIMSDISNNEALRMARRLYDNNLKKIYEGVKK